MFKVTDHTPEVAAFEAVAPMALTPEYSSSAQLAGVAAEMLTLNDVEATEPPALVDHISDRTAVPLVANVRKVHFDPPSVIELIEDVVFPRAHVATTVLPLLLEYGIDSDVSARLFPVVLWAPPTREIPAVSGVEKVKLAEIANWPVAFVESAA